METLRSLLGHFSISVTERYIHTATEQKGWKGKAIEHYEKFLNLWKYADPGILEVESAKKRLGGVKE